MNKISSFLKPLVNMSDHLDYDGATESIRENIYFRGPNVFILACAIIIASVGLNVNSIPVIIGAMLISPVMGPILGFGFGLGTRDDRLVKDSLKNFGVMVSISIVASTLYFILSPLNMEHPTELLARTNPTLYDVLIAFFGGIAGILEISKKKKGTVLAGVAIATALMPPLCTIGYGISLLNWKFIAGAMYLFLINSIFIALATFLAVKYLKYPAVETGGERKMMSSRAVAIILLLIIVPSVVTAVRIVKENNFRIHVSRLVEENKSMGGGFIYDYRIDNSVKPASIVLFMAGEALSDAEKEVFYLKAEKHGILRGQIVFKDDATINTAEMSETEIVKSIYERSEAQICSLSDSISVLNEQLRRYASQEIPAEVILREIQAQCPSVSKVSVSRGATVTAEGEVQDMFFVAVTSANNEAQSQSDLLERWLKVRLNAPALTITFTPSEVAL